MPTIIISKAPNNITPVAIIPTSAPMLRPSPSPPPLVTSDLCDTATNYRVK